MKLNLLEGVRCYLATRRRLGFALAKEGVQLQGLVRYAKHIGHRGALTAQLAVQWAQQPQQTDRLYWASRLDIARRFASFWIAYDPRTEIPPRGLFGPSFRRRPVHVYTPQEISRLLAAATDQSPKRPFRGQTFRTLIGLLACTGMRIGEVLGLADQDLDWTTGVLTIRHAKYGHARLVPLSNSTLKALRDYQQVRHQALGRRPAPTLFVNPHGRPLGCIAVAVAFRRLCRHLGWTQTPVPRLHDLRHTFAVRTLLQWYEQGEPIDPKLWILSTYLGHRHPANTYWYLTAVPELMQWCQQRLASAHPWASGGAAHD
jgi:integrase